MPVMHRPVQHADSSLKPGMDACFHFVPSASGIGIFLISGKARLENRLFAGSQWILGVEPGIPINLGEFKPDFLPVPFGEFGQ